MRKKAGKMRKFCLSFLLYVYFYDLFFNRDYNFTRSTIDVRLREFFVYFYNLPLLFYLVFSNFYVRVVREARK